MTHAPRCLWSLALLILIASSGCGVRGKPQPPLTPAELGRGQPTFKRATEEFAFPEVPTPGPINEKKKTPARDGSSSF